MKLLADITGEKFLEVIETSGDSVIVQFVSNEGRRKGKPFKDSISGLFLTGWTKRTTSTAIGLELFKQGKTEDPRVSFALHQLYPLGRKVKLPTGYIATIASYANTHNDGYYIYLRDEYGLKRFKMTPDWELLPSEELLALPYYPAPKTQKEIDNINDFDKWAAGF
ncbi:hypothetical protein [Aliivibrio fischeri]|uniref:hypothetical protein n=1 Tax=Aliivibrio fischeri TaxID=668 RepID=UPI0012D9B5EA|nr:hypothetical protein [Aliivibrio fischeri]MUJ21667.1 hypothetical protein [Aliivibrio fischeri]MUL08237.1 hypothetical protein [Aliivibrio fischeri]